MGQERTKGGQFWPPFLLFDAANLDEVHPVQLFADSLDQHRIARVKPAVQRFGKRHLLGFLRIWEIEFAAQQRCAEMKFQIVTEFNTE